MIIGSPIFFFILINSYSNFIMNAHSALSFFGQLFFFFGRPYLFLLQEYLAYILLCKNK